MAAEKRKAQKNKALHDNPDAVPEKGASSDEEQITQLEDNTRLIERPDGFYWQDSLTGKIYGPFPTLLEAREDMQYQEDSDYEEGESLQEAEAELGISDWIDPDTGELAEDSSPHLRDE